MTIIALGFFCLYNTSSRAIINKESNFNKWIQFNPLPGEYLGVGLLIFAYLLFCVVYGIGGGILLATVTLMTIGSLVVLLHPLQHFKWRHLFIAFIISLVLETFIF